MNTHTGKDLFRHLHPRRRWAIAGLRIASVCVRKPLIMTSIASGTTWWLQSAHSKIVTRLDNEKARRG